MKATAKDLRFHSKEILEAALRGEEVVITYRGKPSARLMPFRSSGRMSKKHPARKSFGMWRDNDSVKKVGEYVRGLRKGRFE